MMPRPGTWGELTVGMYVQDQSDTAWRIDYLADDPLHTSLRSLGMTRPDGLKTLVTLHAASFGAPVTILEPTHEEAVGLVMQRLDGMVVG